MKARRNSKINNIYKGKNNSLLSKKQGYKSEKREYALGYCMLHQINIGQKMYDKKSCNKCSKFIKFIKKEMKGNE